MKLQSYINHYSFIILIIPVKQTWIHLVKCFTYCQIPILIPLKTHKLSVLIVDAKVTKSLQNSAGMTCGRSYISAPSPPSLFIKIYKATSIIYHSCIKKRYCPIDSDSCTVCSIASRECSQKKQRSVAGTGIYTVLERTIDCRCFHLLIFTFNILNVSVIEVSVWSSTSDWRSSDPGMEIWKQYSEPLPGVCGERHVQMSF